MASYKVLLSNLLEGLMKFTNISVRITGLQDENQARDLPVIKQGAIN
jgi:hypothetical protein